MLIANNSEKSLEGTVALLRVVCSNPSCHIPFGCEDPDSAFFLQSEHVRVSQMSMHNILLRVSLIQSLSGFSVKGIWIIKRTSEFLKKQPFLNTES